MQYIVDRIVDEFAVCYDGSGCKYDIPLEKLYSGVREGDCIEQVGGQYRFDQVLTNKKRQANIDLQNSLFE